ncbi:hypothetical protein HOY82DRAFT_590360 [Tuber indicum]|nr:hypothetical protein HOY82DRAFT_590360 [Tuber indicum]
MNRQRELTCPPPPPMPPDGCRLTRLPYQYRKERSEKTVKTLKSLINELSALIQSRPGSKKREGGADKARLSAPRGTEQAKHGRCYVDHVATDDLEKEKPFSALNSKFLFTTAPCSGLRFPQPEHNPPRLEGKRKEWCTVVIFTLTVCGGGGRGGLDTNAQRSRQRGGKADVEDSGTGTLPYLTSSYDTLYSTFGRVALFYSKYHKYPLVQEEGKRGEGSNNTHFFRFALPA